MTFQTRVSEFFKNAPNKCLGHVVSKLSFKHAMNLTKSSMILSSIFKMDRLHIGGPVFDVVFRVINDKPVIRVLNPSNPESEGKIVDGTKWKSFFEKNLCQNLYIVLGDTLIPQEFLREMFYSWKVDTLHFTGPVIDDPILELFEQMNVQSLVINVEHYGCVAVVSHKITSLMVSNPINSLDRIIATNFQMRILTVIVGLDFLKQVTSILRVMKNYQHDIWQWVVYVHKIKCESLVEYRRAIKSFIAAVSLLSDATMTITIGPMTQDGIVAINIVKV